MINEIRTQKNTVESSEKNISSLKVKPQPSNHSAKVIPRTVSSPAGLGLPVDKLSSSIISFARFFSLPLKPQLLADIRRNAFTPSAANTSAAANINAAQADSMAAVKFREALSLAAAAAESKGTELQPKGLESYAGAVDPEKRKRNKDQRQQDGESLSKVKSSDNTRTGSFGEILRDMEFVSAEGLKKLFYEKEKKDPLLDILNRLPGKNGQRWIVLPFDFTQGRCDFNVSVRILTDGSQVSANACCMALDIIIGDQVTGNGERMLFVTEAANNKPVKLILYLWQALSEKEQAKIKQELSKAMDIPAERIFINTSEESFPFEARLSVPFVDEAV